MDIAQESMRFYYVHGKGGANGTLGKHITLISMVQKQDL